MCGRWRVAAFVIAGIGASGCGQETPPPAPPSSPGIAPPIEAPQAAEVEEPIALPRAADVERKHPSSGPLALQNAFGSEIMVPGAYADAAAQVADRRDGVLEVEVVDAVDGTPIPGVRVSCGGTDSGSPLTLETDGRGVVRFESAPAIWLGVVAEDGANTFARRHDFAWKFVHGPGRVRLPMPRTRWFRFRFEVPDGVAQPERVSVSYESQGSEGLNVVVPSLAGFWNLDEECPRAIALPAAQCRLQFEFDFRPDLPPILLTDVGPGAEERVIRLFERVPVVGRVVEDDPGLRGARPLPDCEIEIELRRRFGDVAIQVVRFGGDGNVRRSTAHSDGTEFSNRRVATVDRVDAGGPWAFSSPKFAPGATFDVIARARRGDEVVACGVAENVAAGGPDVTVPLRPAATIRGVVRDAKGAPLAAPVEVSVTWACEAVSPIAVIASTMTGADGTFEIGGLPRVPVRVQAGGAFFAVHTPKPAEVVAGEEANVVLETQPTMRVSGIVRDAATGRPLACHLEIQQETTSPGGHGISSHGNGRWFAHGLVPGEMRIVVNHHGRRLDEIEPVTITETTKDLAIRLP